jgi:hypothetical protein
LLTSDPGDRENMVGCAKTRLLHSTKILKSI